MNKKQKTSKMLMILLIITIFFSINTLAANDTEAPSIVYSSPKGYLSTTDVTLNAVTDETANCRYGTTDEDYDTLSHSFGINGTNHEAVLSLSEGTHNYYIRCKDESNNSMNESEHVAFKIDTSAPSIISSSPSDTITKDHTILEVVTNEKTICKYDTQNNDYGNLRNPFETTNSTLHKQEIYGLSSKDYTYFIKCRDYADNEVSKDIEFTINLPPTFDIDIEENPPIKEGTYKVEVYTSKNLITAPTMQYKFDDEDKKYDVSLVGENSRWQGYIIIPEFPKNRVGKFMISGKDYDGLTGTKISSGELFLVDTVDPNEPESLNIISYDEKIEIEWDYQGEKVNHYIIFRATSSGVETVDYYDTTDSEKYIDTEIDAGKDYYYRVCAVDDSDNRGTLSKEVRITAVGKKEKEIEVPRLSRTLEIELNSTIEKFRSDILDFEVTIKKLERMTKNEEKLVIDTFSIIENSKKAKDDYADLIKNLDSLRDLDLSKNEFNSRISNIESNADDLKKMIVEDIEIVNSVDFQQVSSEKEIENIHKEAVAGFELSENQLENFSKMSEKLETDAKIYSSIVSTIIRYLDDSTEEYTIFSKEVIIDETRDVWIIENIPKNVAEKASDVDFSNKPRVLKDDPIVLWEYKILNEIDLSYYVEGIISLDDANQVRTHLTYNPNIYIKENPAEENKVTGNAIFSKDILSKLKLNLKDLFMPIMGFIIVVGLLIYYFFFLKEETLGHEHNLQIDAKEEEKELKTYQNPHRIVPVKLNLLDDDREELDNYHHLLNMIDHASANADNMNIESARKEYLLIYNLFNKLDFKDEHTKRGVKNEVIKVYNKIILWQKINRVLSNAHDIPSEKLNEESKNIGMLLSMIHKDEDTLLTNYASDYYNYIEKVKMVKK